MSRSSLCLVLLAVVCAAGCERADESGRPGSRAEAQVVPEQTAARAEQPDVFVAPEFHEGCLHVVDIHGQPVAGATVWRLETYAWGGWRVLPDAEFTTDDLGRVRDDSAHYGSSYSAHKPGYALGRLETTIPGRDPVIILPPSSTRRVRVVGADGQPVAGARLALPSPAPPSAPGGRLAVETDADGYAVLSLSSDLRPPHVYEVLAPGFAATLYGEDSEVVTLGAPGTLIVRVLGDADPASFAGWTVSAVREAEPSGAWPHYSTGPLPFAGEREMTLGYLPPGHFRLYVAPSASDSQHPTDMPREIDVAIGETTLVEVIPAPAYLVRGRVVGEDGTPIVGAAPHISARNGGMGPRFVTDGDGRYLVHLTPGRYVLAQGAAVPPFGPDPDGRSSVEIEVRPGAETVAPDIIMVRATTIRGRVVNERGESVAGAEVLDLGPITDARVYPAGGYSRPVATSDERGEFTVPQWQFLRTRTSLAARTDSAISIEPVPVPEDPAALMELPVRSDAAGWLEGRVSVPDGRPVTRTSVGFRLMKVSAWTGAAGPPSRIPRWPTGASGRVSLDADGSYRAGPLIPGTYEVWVERLFDVGAASAEDIVIDGGQTARVDLVVEPGMVGMGP